MAAVGTVTLKTDQYESMLEKIKQKTGSASNSMSQSMGKVGSQVSKAGGVLKTLGASIGSHFGALGSVISSIAAGPIAMLAAALGSLVAIGTQIWDRLTMSAEEYAAEMERISREAEKAHQSMLKQMDEDSGYMDRLAELAKRENLSNEAKAEAGSLIQMLTSRYGDLGVEIDAVTGRITGMDAAQERFLKKQKEMKSASLQRQIEASENTINSAIYNATSAGGGFMNKFYERFGDAHVDVAEARRRINAAFPNMSPQEQLQWARGAQDDVKTTEEKNAWQAVIDAILKRMDLVSQKKMLDDTSYETEAKAAAAARKKTQEAEAENQKKFKEASPEERVVILDKKIEATKKSVETKVQVAASTSEELTPESRQSVLDAFRKQPLEDQLHYAENVRDSVVFTRESKEKWQAVIDELKRQISLQGQRKDAEESATQAAKRDRDRTTELDRSLEEKKQRGRNAESDYAFAHASTEEEKIANREARIREEEERIRALEEAKKKVDIFADGVEVAQKKLHDYDMAIEDAKQRITGFRHQIDEVKAAPKREEEPVRRPAQRVMTEGFKTDALTARGALLGGGVRSEDSQRTEQVKKVASSAEAIRQIMEQIKEELRIED